MGVWEHPLATLRPEDMQAVQVGVSICSLKPAGTYLTCRLNGEWLARLTVRQRSHYAALVSKGRLDDARAYLSKAAARALNWQRVCTRPGDVIEWHGQPQDKEDFRVVLQVAAVIAAIVPGLQGFAPYLAAASVAYNILVPPTVATPREEEAAGSVFNTSLGGNQARLDQPIWRSFGRVKITPPFAGAPYYEYIDDDLDDLDNIQRYHAVFAVGIDDHEIESVFIGRTPISHYQDVLIAQYLPPGVQPSTALCNVVTSNEVTQLEMDSGKYLGGYAACQPQRRAQHIGIDMLCPQGLGKDGALSISFNVEVRAINEYGYATEAWYVIGSVTKTADTNTPQRWSFKYPIVTPARVEVRVVRTDVKDTSSSARHALQWIGLRAYLDEPATLNPHTAHYEVVMRASEQLSASSQRDFSMIVWPLIRTWSPVGGWGPKVRCRNPAWALADLWSNAVWAEGLPDSRLDLRGLYDISLTADERQDRFDYTFDTATSAWEAAQLIARAMRARCFRRYGVNTLARDEWNDLPMTALTPRNTLPDSMELNERMPVRETPDGVVIQYRSNVTWDTIEIECPCPGFSVSDPADPRFDFYKPAMANPVYMPLKGITGAYQAEREGLYEAANMLLRRRVTTCTTEMEGVITSYMMPILWQPDTPGYGQSGDVAFWNPETRVMGLTEPPVFGLTGQTYLTLIRDDGSLTPAFLVSPGPTEWDVTLPAAPDFEIVTTDGTRERPKFVLGNMDLLVKVASISDGGKSQAEDGMAGAQLFQIDGVVDDERVHTADNHLLPGPGDIQDPVDGGGEFDGGGGTLALVTLKPHTVMDGDSVAGGGVSVTMTLRNDGTMQSTRGSGIYVDDPVEYANEWLLVPVEVAQSAGFEVYATSTLEDAFTAGTFNTWLSMDTERVWTATTNGGVYDRSPIFLRLRIKEVASDIVQGDETMWLQVNEVDLAPGGG